MTHSSRSISSCSAALMAWMSVMSFTPVVRALATVDTDDLLLLRFRPVRTRVGVDVLKGLVGLGIRALLRERDRRIDLGGDAPTDRGQAFDGTDAIRKHAFVEEADGITGHPLLELFRRPVLLY